MYRWRTDRYRSWIPGRDVAAHPYTVPCVRADVGGRHGSDSEFGGRSVLWNLSSAARLATGSDRRLEVRINGDGSLTSPRKLDCGAGYAALVESALGPHDFGNRDWCFLGHFDGGNHSGIE